MSNSSILSINRTLSGATSQDESEPWSNDNEGVLHIPQSSNITGGSLSDCLVSYVGHSLEAGFYLSAEMMSVSTGLETTNVEEQFWFQT